MHALILNARGYSVESTSSETEAHQLCKNFRPDLVLLEFGSLPERMQLGRDIQLQNPRQRIAFLHNQTHRLCPLFLNGELIREAEGADNYPDWVEALLATPTASVQWPDAP